MAYVCHLRLALAGAVLVQCGVDGRREPGDSHEPDSCEPECVSDGEEPDHLGDEVSDDRAPESETDGSCDPLGAIADLDLDGDGIRNADDDDDDDDALPDSVEHVIEDCSLRDADGDGRGDGLDSDSDDDGLCDRVELSAFGTNPLHFDTDGDGWDDYAEVRLGSSPTSDASVPDVPAVVLTLSRPIDLDLIVTADSARAELSLQDVLPPVRGFAGVDFVRTAEIVAISPPDAGSLEGATVVADVRSGARVRLELAAGWPIALPRIPCALAFVLDVALHDETGSPVSDSVRIALVASLHLEPWDTTGVEACGLFPECPPRTW